MDIYIKMADITYIDEIIEFEKECFSHRWSDNIIFSELINMDSYYFMMFEEDVMIGFAGYQEVVGEAHIMTVGIKPDRRGKGYSLILMRVMLNHAAKKGIKDVTLEVREGNEAAIGLYEKLGFKKYGIRKNYYSDNNENALIMWRKENEEEKR